MSGHDPNSQVEHHRGWFIITYRESRWLWNARVRDHATEHDAEFRFGDPFAAFTRARAFAKAKRYIDRVEHNRHRRDVLERAMEEARG